jgi:hypothetical protein
MIQNLRMHGPADGVLEIREIGLLRRVADIEKWIYSPSHSSGVSGAL